MPVDHIRYDLLAQDALRSVVRRVLSDAAKNGLPGEHHFYISFDTRHPGVRISNRLRGQYPEEMTIVLQHQFWDLTVADVGFDVGLSFNGITERLHVPYEAIKGFYDPSVQFGLQFQAALAEEEAETADTERPVAPVAGSDAPAETLPAEKPVTPAAQAPATPLSAETGSANEPGKPAGGGEVVRLDRFRKK